MPASLHGVPPSGRKPVGRSRRRAAQPHGTTPRHPHVPKAFRRHPLVVPVVLVALVVLVVLVAFVALVAFLFVLARRPPRP
ncbi:hypothetical protein [Streptomyces sp. NPDC056291]|uniref:hypothetical protein n=1 Tax=Streptomyces sp. NPDC056291 TaxID=3345772 RepID=UPI0035D703B7